MVLKPSEVTPLNALILAEAIHAAGLPKVLVRAVDAPSQGAFVVTLP